MNSRPELVSIKTFLSLREAGVDDGPSTATYCSVATISGAFSGLISYGIQKNLDGAGG